MTIKGIPPLSQDLVRIANPGRITVAVSPMARLNAQHERLTGAAAPGTAARSYRPHDHCLDGGAILGRGTIFCTDLGGIGNGGYIRHTLAGSATWESILGTSTSRLFMFRAYPTPGLTGTLAAAFVARSYGDDIDIRIVNQTTGTSSSSDTTNAATAAYQGAISDVPFAAGRENQFDVEIRGDAAEQLDLVALVLYEDTATHPSSNGTTTYSGL